MADYRFTLPLDAFDTSLLSPEAPVKGSEGFAAAVHAFLQEQFAGFSGDARIVVTNDTVLVEWTPPSPEHDPIEAAIAKFQAGHPVPAIVMLELLRRVQARDVRLLYNLGLIYSEVGRLDDAGRILGEALAIDPGHVNARVALGFLHAKQGQNEEAIKILEEAVAASPNNPVALRNLGGCLLRIGDLERAVSFLERTAEINPRDPHAFFGLGEAYHAQGKVKEADAAYRAVMKIDEFGALAEEAQKRLSLLAEEEFKRRGGGESRPDATMYCLGALEFFAELPPSQIQKVVFEIAVLGSRGLDTNNSTPKYQLRSMRGNFSGLQLVSYLYVGFKKIAPGQDAGFDLSAEYAVAEEMFRKKRKR